MSGVSLELAHSWTREDIEEAAKERTFTLGSGDQGKIVEAGKKWKVLQNVGRVGYWKIKKLKLKSYDCDCNSICAIDKNIEDIRKNNEEEEEEEITAFPMNEFIVITFVIVLIIFVIIAIFIGIFCFKKYCYKESTPYLLNDFE